MFDVYVNKKRDRLLVIAKGNRSLSSKTQDVGARRKGLTLLATRSSYSWREMASIGADRPIIEKRPWFADVPTAFAP
jgi:hypothetical protein